MGYQKIPNLYKEQEILLFRECYALEKIHGTSANISWNFSSLRFFSGGENHDNFVALFNRDSLIEAFKSQGQEKVTVFGEAYGGKQQRQAWRYGPELRFVAFEVKIGDKWLSVPTAEYFARMLNIPFVHYVRIATDLKKIDAERDAPSEQAKRNGVEGDKPREGVVLRPLIEVTRNNGRRIVAKHKRDEERETRTPRKVDADKLEVLTKADEIAEEWVTPTRLEHVLDRIIGTKGVEQTRTVIDQMIEDILLEGAGEILPSREAKQAIGRKTAKMFKDYLRSQL